MRDVPRTWWGVITERGRERALTIAMGLLIAAATVLSVLYPPTGPWLFVITALIGAAWYLHMMRRWLTRRATNGRNPDGA